MATATTEERLGKRCSAPGIMQHLSSFTEETIQRGQQICRLRTQLEDITTMAPPHLCVSTAMLHGLSSRQGSCSSLTASSKVLHGGGKGPEAGAGEVAEELSPKLQEGRKVKAGAYG